MCHPDLRMGTAVQHAWGWPPHWEMWGRVNRQHDRACVLGAGVYGSYISVGQADGLLMAVQSRAVWVCPGVCGVGGSVGG